MSTILCISEIEEPIIFQSSLTVSLKQQYNMYCVLVKDYFILFKKPSDIISFKRLPISNKTNIELDNSQNSLSISIGSNKYTFISTDFALIENLFDEITCLINKYISPKPLIDYEYAEVKIDQIGSSSVYILMGHEDYHLFIYENLEEHQDNIVSHIINCKFYSPENDPTHSTTKSIKLLGKNQTFKINFKDDKIVDFWKNLFSKSLTSAFNDDNFKILTDIYDNESNRSCADCGSPNPEWVSVNLFVIVCINCAGIHRSLGTSVSRIQSATIDKRIWENSNLVEIMREIGNEKLNSFWCRNKPKSIDNKNSCHSILSDYTTFIKEKYLMRKYIDNEFIDNSEEELIGKLKLSVGTNDLFLTIRLWNSINFEYNSDFVENLLEISKNSHQNLQHEFLSVQPWKKSILSPDSPIVVSENVLQIAINNSNSNNNSGKLNDLFLVSLLNNCISIKVENCSVSPIELINVCCIYFDNIDLVWYDYFNNENLIISVNPASIFHRIIGKISLNNYHQIDVDRFAFFSQSKPVLKNLKFDLLKLLISNDNKIININNDDLILFISVDVRKNFERFSKCKCFVTDHEIIFLSPFSMLYDLKKSEKCVLIDDKKSILIKFKVDELELITTGVENQRIIYNCLEKGMKSSELLKDPIDKMIFFISSRGLKSEGIFRIGGAIKKVDALFKTIEKPTGFTIDPTVYNVNDVASCLKKYFRSLDEPIISLDLFDKFKRASIEPNVNEKLSLYKEGLSHLPRDNYLVFRKLLELFYMIQIPTNNNRMDSSSLSISVSSSFISFDNSNIQINSNIMRDLIENFVVLFDCSKTELEILRKFVEGPESVDQNIIRTFYVHPKLKENLTISKFDNGKLNFLEREISYIVISININKCVVVKHVYELFFKDYEMQLWHFLTKRSGFSLKTIKRLIYLNDGITHSIRFPRTLVNYDSYFVFLINPQQNMSSSVRRLFQCEVKLKSGEKYQDFTLMMNFPNSLQFFDSKSQSLDPVYNFLLSDIIVYRFHMKNISKIFILFGINGFIRVKFDNFDVLKEFLCFYDQFRN